MGIVALLATACGGSGSAGTDPGTRDAAQTEDGGARRDGAARDDGGPIDPGPPPACAVTATAARVFDRPTLERNEDPSFFGPLDADRERFAFLGKAADAERRVSIRAVVAPREPGRGDVATVATFEEGEDAPRFTAAFGSGGVLAMWQRSSGSLDRPGT
ncbi:MAG: hypothetical protein IT379_17380, partial [Deltaproteobacteria bacterium]|nr:hypothetical protein [Deltaproteobacteria bacterium]